MQHMRKLFAFLTEFVYIYYLYLLGVMFSIAAFTNCFQKFKEYFSKHNKWVSRICED